MEHLSANALWFSVLGADRLGLNGTQAPISIDHDKKRGELFAAVLLARATTGEAVCWADARYVVDGVGKKRHVSNQDHWSDLDDALSVRSGTIDYRTSTPTTVAVS